MGQPKKLIEVAMPIKEISAESVRDKSIRHGHISTLHIWWARRPLPVCRAVVFASLVPDPLDNNCPTQFKEAVNILLGKEKNIGDPYKPYINIPYTASVDKMEDNFRNRLLMFIGKFSDKYILLGEKTLAKDKLSEQSLIKWDNKDNEIVIEKARKLIWVSHNADTGKTCTELLREFDELNKAIKNAEYELYNLINRHLESPEVQEKTTDLQLAVDSFLDRMPKVFDPFAGGGAIPLEAGRLGCRSFGNDINPVAHVIQKGSLAYPQKYGKPIVYDKTEFIKLYGVHEWNSQKLISKIVVDGEAVAIKIPNRLSFDVAFYSKQLLSYAEEEIGAFYPADVKGKKPVAYYWAYQGTCANPSCRAKVPLIKQFYLVNKPDKKVYLNPVINDRDITFEIKNGKYDAETWIQRKNLKCPVCGNVTSIVELKRQFNAKEPKKILIAVIEEGNNSKNYRLPTKSEIEILKNLPENIERPLGKMPIGNNRDLHCMGWGVVEWADMFTERQLLLMNTLVSKLEIYKENIFENSDYQEALLTYLAIFIDRIAAVNTAFGRWNVAGEKLETPFSRQAIPFMLDFPESNPFSNSTGSALNQLDWITRYIESECNHPFETTLKNATSGDESQFSPKFLDCVVTDPPYYDAIAYADLSDFFYTWLKKMIGDVFYLNFAVPQTPKTDECTALKHHHNGNMGDAKHHFEKKLLEIFSAIEKQTKDIVSIMFAHQSTEAWTTLCNSILDARMNITGSWAIDTEMGARMVAMDNAALQSSVTVSCRPTIREGYGEYRQVKKAIESTVAKEVDELYHLGFRGADLLTACFGQAVSEFGKYEKVEKADGSEVTVAELLEMARESAFNALLKGFEGDEFTKFYIGWLQLYGFLETDFDDAAKFSRIGLSINVQDLFSSHILIKKINKQVLGGFTARLHINSKLGEQEKSILIDKVHRGMGLYKDGNRQLLLKYISNVAPNADDSFWRVITSLCEILPQDTLDYEQALGLQTNKESLVRDSKLVIKDNSEQTALEL